MYMYRKHTEHNTRIRIYIQFKKRNVWWIVYLDLYAKNISHGPQIAYVSRISSISTKFCRLKSIRRKKAENLINSNGENHKIVNKVYIFNFENGKYFL
jgi:hypothetical protein